MPTELEKLYAAVREIRDSRNGHTRTSELFDAGATKIAKKVMEESAEVSLAYSNGNYDEVVRETADLLYNLIVLLVDQGVTLEEVWSEMESREAILGIAGKVPKDLSQDVQDHASNGRD